MAVTMQAQEGLLRQVLRVLAIAHHAVEETVDALLMALDQLFESLLVPALPAGDELPVRILDDDSWAGQLARQWIRAPYHGPSLDEFVGHGSPLRRQTPLFERGFRRGLHRRSRDVRLRSAHEAQPPRGRPPREPVAPSPWDRPETAGAVIPSHRSRPALRRPLIVLPPVRARARSPLLRCARRIRSCRPASPPGGCDRRPSRGRPPCTCRRS